MDISDVTFDKMSAHGALVHNTAIRGYILFSCLWKHLRVALENQASVIFFFFFFFWMMMAICQPHKLCLSGV